MVMFLLGISAIGNNEIKQNSVNWRYFALFLTLFE